MGLPAVYRNLTTKIKAFIGQLFVSGISAEDIDQAIIGDCYFAASVAAIADFHPKVIEKIIQKINEQYEVYFYSLKIKNVTNYKIGEKQHVVIDNTLYIDQNNNPVYGVTDTLNHREQFTELWYAMLEKAYATWKGNSYKNIGEGGYPHFALSELLGKQCTIFTTDINWVKQAMRFSDERAMEYIWNYIKNACANRYPMVAGTRGEGEKIDGLNPHIFSGHAYSIHNAITNNDGKHLIIRNPWGNHRARPTYADYKSDGFFNLTIEDFFKYFNYACFCPYKD